MGLDTHTHSQLQSLTHLIVTYKDTFDHASCTSKGHTTILVAHDPPSPPSYLMITHTHPIADNLSKILSLLGNND